MFLPPYSPDFMPCEELFAQTKNWIRESDVASQFCMDPQSMVEEAFLLLMNKLETTFDMPNTCDK